MRLIIWLCSFFIGINALSAQCVEQKMPKILLVGDSWLHFPFLYKTHETVMKEYGFEDVEILGNNTVVGGTVTSSWTQGNGKFFVLQALKNYPEIELISLSMGGNDLIYEIRGGMSFEETQQIIDKQDANTRNMIDIIRAVRPDVKILLNGYDYPNLLEVIQNPPRSGDGADVNKIYQSLFLVTEKPGQEFTNSVLVRLEDTKQQIANDYQDVMYLRSLGLMQYIYGYDSIFCSEYGSFPPKSVPFPGGDVRYPSPQYAMAYDGGDAIHLSPQSFLYLMRYHAENFFLPYLRKQPEFTFKASNPSSNGTVASNGVVLENDIKLGDKAKGENYKAIVSFNVEGLPSSNEIESATLFLKRKSATSLFPSLINNPFFKMELANGVFGGTENLEPGDYSSPAKVSSNVCAVGKTREDGHVLRIALTPEMISALPSSGTVQFRFSQPANGSAITSDQWISFFGAGGNEYESPYLDIQLKSVTGIKDLQKSDIQFSLFPNPAKNGVANLRLPENSSAWNVSVTDMSGRVCWSASRQTGLISLETSNLSKGMYVVQIQNESGAGVQKLMVQ